MKLWNWIQMVVSSVIEAKELRMKERNRNNRFFYL